MTRHDAHVVEIVPERLYALGGTVRNDGRISWVPERNGGALPINCYLLKEAGAALLVDTGPACHREQVVMPLRSLLGAGTPLSVFLTRAEADCIGNLGAVVRSLNVETVYGGGRQNPFDFVDDALDHMMDQASDDEIVQSLSGRTVQRRPDGAHIELGPERRLHVHAAPLRILQTFWAYDDATATLFVSDFFSHNMVHDGQEARLLEEEIPEDDPRSGVEAAQAHIFTKFEWMRIAERTLLRRKLRALFAAKPVRVLAPGFGRIVRGERAVAQQVHLIEEALAR